MKFLCVKTILTLFYSILHLKASRVLCTATCSTSCCHTLLDPWNVRVRMYVCMYVCIKKSINVHRTTTNFINPANICYTFRSCYLAEDCQCVTGVDGINTWNKEKCQLDATRQFYWCILSSTCFGYIRPSSGALDVELQRMVFCTEFLDGWWSWMLLRRSCLQCGWCRAAPSASCSIWFSAPSFWMGGGLESRCESHVYGADGALQHRTVNTTYAAALKTTTHPKTRCRKPYAATQHPMLLMIGVCTPNTSR